jgi:glycosyltransferase involved in cell wall biosynthesis
LYQGAAGLLFLSKGEGFGLPLVEAASYGVPIVCSDIPAFREVAGPFATYVRLEDPASLALEIENWLRRRAAGQLPDTKAMPRLTWRESAEKLLEVVVDGRWMWTAP